MRYSQSRRQVNARFLLARCVFIGRGLALLLLLPALTALGADATPDQPTCLLLTVEGKIEMARKGTLQWTAGQANQILQPGHSPLVGPERDAGQRVDEPGNPTAGKGRSEARARSEIRCELLL